MTCNVTGTVITPDGKLFANGEITFKKQSGVGAITIDSVGSVLVPTSVTVKTNSAGEIDVNLVYGSYRATAKNSQGAWSFLVGVPDVATVDFSECVDLVPDLSENLVTGIVLGYRDDAEAAAATATTKAAEASSSASNASDSSTLSAAWAEGTLPGGAGTKSAQEHAADAEASANTSEAWAITPEDTPVSGSDYSSLHWAAKAASSAATVNPSNFQPINATLTSISDSSEMDGVAIGQTTPAAGTFTTIEAPEVYSPGAGGITFYASDGITTIATLADDGTFSANGLADSGVPLGQAAFKDTAASITGSTNVALDSAVKTYVDGGSWNDVTGSRSSGVTYTNNTGSTIEVACYATTTATGSASLEAKTNGSTLCKSAVYGSGSGYSPSLIFSVPDGETYSITLTGSGTPAITSWKER